MESYEIDYSNGGGYNKNGSSKDKDYYRDSYKGINMNNL
jgi:hypothetical protein